MTHIHIILLIIFSFVLIALFLLLKNKPQYLLFIGIRGLFCTFLIKFINYLCSIANLSAVVAPNPVSFFAGTFLGFPGVLLLYLLRLYFLL